MVNPTYLVRLQNDWFLLFEQIGQMKVPQEVAEKIKSENGVVAESPAGFDEKYFLPRSLSISRAQFMDFFRDTEKLNELTVDDITEIFKGILVGPSDLKKKLLIEILNDYPVEGHIIWQR